MKTVLRVGGFILANAVLAGAFWMAHGSASADYFDPDDATVPHDQDVCTTGHDGGDNHSGDCDQANLTLTIKHHGAYLTDWILLPYNYSGGVWCTWFESGSDDDSYAFGFQGSASPKVINFHVQSTGGNEDLIVELRHDDDDDDSWDTTDELFDYFELWLYG